jgi:hypothetical protein
MPGLSMQSVLKEGESAWCDVRKSNCAIIIFLNP